MNPAEPYEEINILDYLAVLWKRKWLIIIPTVVLAVAAWVYGLFLKPVWEIDAIFVPSQFLDQATQTDTGQLAEVPTIDMKQIIGLISQEIYNGPIAAELNLESVPDINAENLKDTKLVRIWTSVEDRDTGVKILNSLFNLIKTDLDRKIQFELKRTEAQIGERETALKQNDLGIKDQMSEIKRLEIQKNKSQEEIASAKNKIRISEERYQAILEETASVKKKSDELADQFKKVLAQNQGESHALNILLYSSEIQGSLQYFNSLNEKASIERIMQESLSLNLKIKGDEIREDDIQIEKIKNEIDRLNITADHINKQIELLKERKTRIDYAHMIKAPTPSASPISPDKKKYIFLAGFLGLILFGLLALFLEYIENNKKKFTG